jgi:hypothetical protein
MAKTKIIGVMREDAFIEIPDYVIRDRSLSILEIIVKYLKEEYEFSYHDIALLLNRDDRTIWTVYNRASKKAGEIKYDKEEHIVDIPTKIFKDRTLSSLEVIVEYMKEELELSLHEIAICLARDDSTVWTIYNRARQKRSENIKNKQKVSSIR